MRKTLASLVRGGGREGARVDGGAREGSAGRGGGGGGGAGREGGAGRQSGAGGAWREGGVLDVGTAVRVGARAGAAHLWVRALSAKMRTESGVLCFRILPILSLMTCRFIHTLTQTTPRARGTPLLMDAGPLHWVSGSALLLHGQEHRVFTEGASCQTRQQVSLCDCGCEFG